jgi:pilus assembly protein Flp/PilA
MAGRGHHVWLRSLPLTHKICRKLNGSRASSIYGTREEARRHYQEVVLKQLLLRFLANQSGATAIEYALLAAGIALAIITAVNSIGTTLNTSYASINSSLK